MTNSITCPASSQLSEIDLDTLSLIFTKPLRGQLMGLRNILSSRNASFRTYEAGTVTFDMDAMLREVSFKCSSMAAQKLSELVAKGLCLQAIASTPLSIPLTGTERIALRT
ncbi:hypothetical protein SAMN04489798_2502 [Pseudomonas arsenicoxydans]|uniref:Uncharacterized protein n=1 Tax=Pseudomonas arsenicoxydans TaxID=702115 RepID=A0A1H0I5Q0_9PSED|nr:hypothetical protein [Pseudomonas arsenicoxydans]SDO26749.1 hypothetical protein SAMN04489798_2502 [Pseudomonas arsenicoxydans]